MGTGDILLEVTLRWTSILSRGGVAIFLGMLHAKETGISFSRFGRPLVHGAFTFFTFTFVRVMVWLKVLSSWLCSNGDQFWPLASNVCPLGFKYQCTQHINALTLALKVEVRCQHYLPQEVFDQMYGTNLSHFSSKETGFIVLTLYAFNPGIVAMRTDR